MLNFKKKKKKKNLNPQTVVVRSSDPAELTHRIQKCLFKVHSPLQLIAGCWSSQELYKNFILIFSGQIMLDEMSTYNDIFFEPFGPSSRAAPTFGSDRSLWAGSLFLAMETGTHAPQPSSIKNLPNVLLFIIFPF